MQIIMFALLLILLVAFIIYKVNGKFETKEISILLSLIIICIGTTIYLLQKKETKVPELFKERYQINKNLEITKLSSERLNDKYLSSKNNFVYNFDYIITKEDGEYICSVKNIKIKKIEDEYIFENFNKLNEECYKK